MVTRSNTVGIVTLELSVSDVTYLQEKVDVNVVG